MSKVTTLQKNIAREIIRLRLNQMTVNEAYKAGKIRIPVHFAFGHESLAVAVSFAMSSQDKLILSHRNIAYNLAREKSSRSFLDEYLLKKTGLAGGRFGSMNLINPARGVIYTSSILANQFPVACGVSLGRGLIKGKGVVWVLGGDGAIEEGAFYESLLLARSVGLPVIFLIEDNGWSMHTKISERRTPINLKKFAESLGAKYVYLEGNNPYEYVKKLAVVRDILIKSKVPVCIEAKVRTLGDWYSPKSPEYPKGKFVKYHTGASPSTILSKWPIMKENSDDPLFVLSKLIPVSVLKDIASREFKILSEEMI